MEKIISISEVENRKIKQEGCVFAISYDGFEIVTDQQTIFVGISNGINCCESWGYVTSIDNSEDFIGAELLDVVVVDENLIATSIKLKEVGESIEDGDFGAVFVNFETSKGLFQLTMYNCHNGYYGHDVTIISNQLSKKLTI